MRSTEARPRSLGVRVVRGTVLSASIAALLAASTSLLLADYLVLHAEDRRLTTMARVAISELPAGDDSTALAQAVVEEERELAPASMRVAVRRGAFVGGDSRLPRLASGTCASSTLDAAELRACGLTAGDVHVVVGSVGAQHPTSLLLGCLVAATLVAALVAAALGRRAASWALGPLVALRRSVATMELTTAQAPAMPAGESCEEVDAIRDALASLIERLRAALGAAQRFSADAAHELKTPLTTIRAELELLAEGELPDATRQTVTKLCARVEDMSRLAERLLALANAEQRSRIDAVAVAMEDVVQRVMARLEPAKAARVRLRGDAQGMVRGDEVLLASAVENVIDNALKFSDGPVDVRIDEADRRVLVTVRDEGRGLSTDERDRAFEPFFRTPRARGANTPGHGIGLAVVAQIVRAHGGDVRFVEAAAEAGATLRISLPAWLEARKAAPT